MGVSSFKYLFGYRKSFPTSPIAVARFWNFGGWGIPRFKSLAMIFATLHRSLNYTSINNYLAGSEGQLFLRDTMVKSLAPLAPLESFFSGKQGRSPGISAATPQSL